MSSVFAVPAGRVAKFVVFFAWLAVIVLTIGTNLPGISADAIKVFESINGTLVGAAFLLVIVLLILIYRSPVFWFFPILAVAFAEITARGIGWALTEAGITVNGQSSAILSVLVIGAGTGYALLLLARYREELRRHEDKHEAMAI